MEGLPQGTFSSTVNTQRERRPDQFRRILLPSRDDAPVVPGEEAPLADPVVVARETVHIAELRGRTTLSYIQRPLRRRTAATANG